MSDIFLFSDSPETERLVFPFASASGFPATIPGIAGGGGVAVTNPGFPSDEKRPPVIGRSPIMGTLSRPKELAPSLLSFSGGAAGKLVASAMLAGISAGAVTLWEVPADGPYANSKP